MVSKSLLNIAVQTKNADTIKLAQWTKIRTDLPALTLKSPLLHKKFLLLVALFAVFI